MASTRQPYGEGIVLPMWDMHARISKSKFSTAIYNILRFDGPSSKARHRHLELIRNDRVGAEAVTGPFAYLLNAFLLSALLIVWLRQVAVPLGLVDMPDSRKRHDGVVPLCGGIAIFVASAVAGLGLPPGFQVPGNLWAGLTVLLLIGIADDRWRLPPWPRLLGETAAACILVAGVFAPFSFNVGLVLPPEFISWAQPLIALAVVVFVVGAMNAVNMMDGADGLAGAGVAAALFWLALASSHEGRPDLALHALLLLSATLAFLVFNMRHRWRSRASVFMGEAGSITLGGAVASIIVLLSSGENGVPFPILLWILIVPITDTLSLIVRRLRAHRNPLSADRWHLHHLLLNMNFSQAVAVGTIAAVSALCGSVAYLAIVFNVSSSVMAIGLVAPVLAHIALVTHAARRARFDRHDQAADAGVRIPHALTSADGPKAGG